MKIDHRKHFETKLMLFHTPTRTGFVQSSRQKTPLGQSLSGRGDDMPSRDPIESNTIVHGIKKLMMDTFQ
jgi:hypothetical protein